MFIEIPASKKSLVQRKPKHGVGINDARYMVCTHIDGKRSMCPFYMVWKNILKRCYDNKHQLTAKSYVGCSVCPDWIYFSNFKSWMQRQDWRGKDLDKDILVSGNKVYSPETCIFVPKSINNLLTNHAAARGKWPIGVSFDKNTQMFVAQCRNESEKIYLGRFDSPAEAHKIYCKFKSNVVDGAALKQDGRLKVALLRIAGEIRSGEYYS